MSDMSLQRTGQIACHKQVREIARAAAGELYEKMMGDNEMFGEWKKQNPDATPKQLESRFVERNWPACIDFARATLALMLRKEDISDATKEEILDVLEKDQSLRGKRFLH